MSSSPFLARLNSNYAAEDDDIPQLDSIIIQSTIELESIRIEMERTRKLYMKLAGQHERLLNYMEAHRALLSPARRLPVEVLQEIFHHCSPDKVEGTLVDHRQAPVLLTHICSSWRRIAIATPLLWSSIHIVLPRHKLEAQGQTQSKTQPQTIYSWTLRAVTEWLSRSGIPTASMPLNISILDPDTRFSVTDPPSEKIIALVLRYCQRIKSLSLNIPARFLDRYFLDLPASSVPLLRSLTISEAYTPWRGEFLSDTRPGAPWRSAGIMLAPNLTSVSIRYSLADLRREKFHQLPLRWSLLTSIYLHVCDAESVTSDISSVALISTLAQCTSLVKCSLQSSGRRDWQSRDNTHTYSGPEVVLSHLECLRIEGIAEDFALFMEELKAPGLHGLELMVLASKNTSPRYRSAVTSFLDDYGPQLRALTIAPTTMSAAYFPQLLENLVNLQVLHLLGRGWMPSFDNVATVVHPLGTAAQHDGFSMSSYTFRLLSGNLGQGQSNTTALLPNLVVFYCNMLGELYVDDQDIVGFVMARRSNLRNDDTVPLGSVPLHEMTVELNRPRDITSAFLKKQLEPYIASGCKITIRYLGEQIAS